MARVKATAEAAAELEFEAEQDVRTLVRAEEIRKDKKRLGRAMASARKQMGALKKVKS